MIEPSTSTADGTSDLEQDILGMIVGERELMRGPGEALMSVNGWIDRLRSAAAEAHRSRRGSELQAERHWWVTIAALGLARAAIVQAEIDASPHAPSHARPDPELQPFCASCGSTDRNIRYSQQGEQPCQDPWHNLEDR